MKKSVVFINIVTSVLFLNFIVPEIQFQINAYKFNNSALSIINQLDINELANNTKKYLDEAGNLKMKIIEKSSNGAVSTKNSLSKTKNVEKTNSVNLTNIPEGRKKILDESQKYIGIPYAFGSKDPKTGFDCSGYVSYVYKKSINYNLPNGSKNQFANGGGILVNYDQLKPGDLMFFSHNGYAIQHVGIYAGDDMFIHAPRSGRRISIDDVGRYWKQKFVKGRSIIK